MTTTTQNKMQEIKDLCDLYGLVFKRGDFRKGARFKISLEMKDESFSWPCQNLQQCREAIFQADYMRHHQIVA